MTKKLFQLNQKLPDTLHELLDVALEDVARVEKMPNVLINMGVWHEPTWQRDEDGNLSLPDCMACAAGSVMICRSPVTSDQNIDPWDYELHDRSRLLAIDELRSGSVSRAYRRLFCLSHRDVIPGICESLDREVAWYEYVDPEPWWIDMMELHMDLSKAGV